MDFKTDKKLQTLLNSKDQDAAGEAADGTCTSGCDNDGSTGFEIFENGVELGIQAATEKKDVWKFEVEDNTLFFLGTKEEVRQKIEALPDNEEIDDEEEESEEDEEEDEDE